MWKLSNLTNRKDQILAKRRRICVKFFETVYEKFINIHTGIIPCNYDPAKECYKEAAAGSKGMALDTHSLLKGDYIYIGCYDFSFCERDMPVEMAACLLGESYSKADAWDIEYICEGKYIYVYFRYSADYRISFDNQFTFHVTDTMDNSIIRSNIPLDKLEDILMKFKGMRLDIHDTNFWYVHLTKQREPVLFSPDKFRDYPNIYVGVLEKSGRVTYKPLIFSSHTKKQPWVSPEYRDHPYVRRFIEEQTNVERKDSYGRLQSKGNIQNTRRRNSDLRRPAFNQQKQGQAQEHGAGKPVHHREAV